MIRESRQYFYMIDLFSESYHLYHYFKPSLLVDLIISIISGSSSINVITVSLPLPAGILGFSQNLV